MTEVLRFPMEQTLEFSIQEDPREFLLLTLEGQPPARQKCILMNARLSGVFGPYMNNQDFEQIMNAYGLGGK